MRTSSSIGLTCLPFVPGRPDAVSWEHAIKIADLALYRAKRGRNAWRGWFGTESVANLHTRSSVSRGRIQRRRLDRQRRHHRTFIHPWQRRHRQRPAGIARSALTEYSFGMDTEIREAIAKSLPDLALIVRRDGIILSCVGGHAVRGLNASEEEIPGRNVSTLWPEQMATTCCRPCVASSRRASRRCSATRMATSSSRCASRCRASTACSSCAAISAPAPRPMIRASIEKSASLMLPHRDGFEKSLRMALDMAALREDTVGVVLIHIGGYVTYQRVFDSALANRLVEAAAKVIAENLPEGRSNLPRIARVSDDVIGVVLTDIRSRADADAAVEAIIKALQHPVDLDGQIFQLAPQAGVTLSGTDGARAVELVERALTTLDSGRRQGETGRHLLFRHAAPGLAHAARLAAGTHPGASRRTSSSCTTSRATCSPRARSSPSKPSCAGRTRFAAWCPTSEFLPIAELSGLSVQLGRWVLRRACRDLAVLAERGYPAAARLGERRPPIPVRREPRRRRHQFGEGSRHRALAARPGNHRTDVVHRPQRARGAAPAARPGRARAHRRLRHRLCFARQDCAASRSTAS